MTSIISVRAVSGRERQRKRFSTCRRLSLPSSPLLTALSFGCNARGGLGDEVRIPFKLNGSQWFPRPSQIPRYSKRSPGKSVRSGAVLLMTR